MAHEGEGGQDDVPVNLVVTTHNPACTAIFMHGRDGVALQTELRPDPITQNSYTAGEIRAGINLTYATTARLAGELVPALAERQVVSSVASYSVSDPLVLLANATSSVIDKRCADNEMPDHLFRKIYDIVLQSSKAPGASASSRLSGASGDSEMPASGQITAWIRITTINSNAEVLALLEEHGIPAHIVDEPRPDSKYHGFMSANVPVSLLIPLTQLDSVVDVEDMNAYTLQPARGFGNIVSEGMDYHPYVESWHNSSYDGGGIGIGVIDGGFDGFDSTAELPSTVGFRCYHYRILSESSTNANLCYGPIINGTQVADRHGTQVAEIIMDMAPAADLYLVRVDNIRQMHDALEWLNGKGVDVINLSGTFPFEGPGNGTSQELYIEWSALAAIDEAAKEGITWVNAAGNFADGSSWATTSPKNKTSDGHRWIAFDGASDIDNKLHGYPGTIDLRWHHSTDPNTDLNLYVYDGSGIARRVSEDNQWNAMYPKSTERIEFGSIPSSGGPYKVRITVNSTTIPEFIQLTVDQNGVLGHKNPNMSLGSPADSANPGMRAVGAIYKHPFEGYQILPESSRGPTTDGRHKPDIMGLSGVSTGPLPGNTAPATFWGTSAAAPHVSGMIALIYDFLGLNANTRPTDLADNYATHPNNTEKDSQYGSGIAGLIRLASTNTTSTDGKAPTFFGQYLKDRTISQGRPTTTSVIAKDPDAITYNATSSDTTVLSAAPSTSRWLEPIRGIFSANDPLRGGLIYLNPNSAGTATVTVTISDGAQHATKSFQVTVSDNTHPTMESIDRQNLKVGTAKTVPIMASDPDGDQLTYQHYMPTHVSSISVSRSGSVLTVTPTAAGQDPVLVEVTDGRGGSAWKVFTNCVVADNSNPRVSSIPDQMVTHGKTKTVEISATDDDGDTLRFASPITDDIQLASVDLSGVSLPLSTMSVGAAATSLAIDTITIQNDTVVNATLSGRDSYGNVFRYVVDATGVVPHVPTSIQLASGNYGCETRSETPSTSHSRLTVSGLDVGNTTITVEVQDAWGGYGTRNFTLTVLPAAPVITLAGQTNMTIPFNTTYVEPGYTATDREDGDITANVTVTGTVDAAKIGTYRLHYDVSDSSGNAAVRQVRTVHVADVTPPVITLAGQTNMTVQVNSTYADPGYAATDDYDGDLTGNVVVTGTVDTSTLGTYTIQYDVADSSGNAAVTQNRTVTVVADGAPPVITLKGQRAMTVEGGTIYVEPGYAATDDIDGNVTGMVVVTGMVDTTVLDTYTIYYDVSDSVGNAAITQSRTVTVVDTTPPVLTLIDGAEITIPASVPYVDPGYEAIDAMDGNVTDRVNVVGTVNTDALGLYKILYIVADSSGNLADTLERNVIVADMTPPVITLKGGSEVWVAKGTAYAEPGYAAIDNIDGNVTGMVVVTGTVDADTEGTYVLHYDITDRAGNAAITQNRTVTVAAGDASPVITLKGQQEMTVEVRAGYVEPGYTATDHEDGNITANVTVTGTVDTATTGTYRLHYDVSDSSGNQAVQQVRTVRVGDVTPPTITLAGPADVTIQVNSAYADPGYTATDDYDGDLTGNVTVTGTVDTATTGTYRLHYDVSDSSGNQAVQQVRTVRVGDVTPPTITLAGPADVTIQVNSAYADPGYTATDDYDGDLTGNVTVTGTVDTATTGTYRLYYDVSDSSGNHAVQQVRTVHVVAATPPAIALSGPHTVTVPFGSTYSEPGYTATDPEDGDLTSSVVVTGTVDATKTGTYTLYYDVSDRFGNAAVQQTRIVRVVDVTPPTITLAGQTNMTIPVNTTYAEPGYAATDDYDGDLTGKVAVTGTVDAAKIGTYKIYYDVSDSSGNAAMQQVRTVHVEAIPDPQAGLPEVVKRYDTDRNGSISQQEWARAIQDYTNGLLTNEEIYAISAARSHG